MCDRSAISYSSSDDIGKCLTDKLSRDIYNDIAEIYTNESITNKEFLLYGLFDKYGEHYLIHYFIGFFYDKLNNFRLAEVHYKLCISKFQFIDAYLNLAIIYQKCGQMSLAKKTLEIAERSEPDELRVLNFLGAIYYLEKDFYLAISHYEKIINSHQNSNDISLKHIYNNLGFSCSAVGKCKRALNYFEYGLRIQSKKTPETMKLDAQLLQNKLINYDYMYDIPDNVFDEFLRINTFLETTRQYISTQEKNGSHPKIKVGYISPDFRQHVCAFFFDVIFKYFDRTKFDVYCYANVMFEDTVSNQIKNLHGIRWFNIYDRSTQYICDLIKSHDIDILVDLAGHTNGNCLNVMAKKPAPIQMTYLGYPNTTGMTNVDYRITDKIADPPNTKQKYSEKLIYLPRCFICYNISVDFNSISITYMPKCYITFGVLNKLNKHNKMTFKAWRDILLNVPNSILLIKRDMKSAFDIRVKYLKKIGVQSERIKVIDYVPTQLDYYNMYNDIDVCLDTFPYSGTTTSCDTLLMSTPIITYAIPDRHVSNVSKSLLCNMGYPELVAGNFDEYVDLAVKLANDRDRIVSYKQSIRGRFIELMNPIKFANEFDELMRTTYLHHYGLDCVRYRK